MENRYGYELFELFGAKLIQRIVTETPVQFNDFLQYKDKVLQVKQIVHELGDSGFPLRTKLFAINVQTNEEAKRD